jgi:membrane-associated protease RseP (regulator of RpoE activity)
MRVYEFGMGFPPRVFGVYRDPVTKKFVFVRRNKIQIPRNKKTIDTLNETVGGGETEEEFPATLYSLNWLPLGGFCKIKGENGEAQSAPDSFGHQKVWKRLVVLVAGVAMNFLLAAVLLGFGLAIGLPADLSGPLPASAIIVEPAHVTIQQVETGSPAEEAGLQFGDQVVSMNGVLMANTNHMIDFTRQHGGEQIEVIVKRGEKQMVVSVRNVEAALGNGRKTPTFSEKKNRALARKSLVLARFLKRGAAIRREDMTVKRPGNGISPAELQKVVGLRLKTDKAKDDVLKWDDFEKRRMS